MADPAYHTVTQLKNDFPAMVFAASCCNADPQAYDNLGYQMLCNNAIGFVGATVEIFSPDAPAQLFAQYLANNVTSGSIGDALNAAKSLEGDKDHSCMLNLYGCPEVSLGLDSLAGRLQIPRNVTAHAAPWGSPILLTWSAVQGATSYCIERGANNGRGFESDQGQLPGVPQATRTLGSIIAFSTNTAYAPVTTKAAGADIRRRIPPQPMIRERAPCRLKRQAALPPQRVQTARS